MHVWTKTKIQAPATLLLTCLTISSANILTDVPKHNPLNILWSPAPPPADGPPLSASASRNPALLPAQIGAIIGAYLFSVCIVGIALICIGRKLRHQAQISPKALDIEMVEPRPPTYTTDPSPISPGAIPGGPRNFAWPSPEKDIKNPYVFPTTCKSPRTPPPAIGDPYVDTRIVEADREMLNRDLEDIYAHVMAQEEAKAAGVAPKEMPLPTQLQKTGPVPMTAPQRQPTPPKKVEKTRPANLNIDETKSNSSKGHSRVSSIISSLKSPRKGVKGMRISSPIPTPLSSAFPTSQSEEEEPLTPRYYSPPPPPPVPKDQVPYTHSRNTSNVTATSVPAAPTSPTRSLAEQLNRNPYSAGVRHRANPSQASQASLQTSIHNDRNRDRDRDREPDPISAASATSQTPLTAPPSKRQPSPNPPSTNSSTRALPLRQFEPPLASPSFVSSTKTTVLERTGPVGGNGPQTGGLRTPWSAGAVPYSPYQPFSPVIPVTPRLVTKEERKAQKKREGRTPVLEMIKSEDELWDSGY